MTIELTMEQRKVLFAPGYTGISVIDPADNREYVLVPKEEYDELKEEKEMRAIVRMSTRNVARRMMEEQ